MIAGYLPSAVGLTIFLSSAVNGGFFLIPHQGSSRVFTLEIFTWDDENWEKLEVFPNEWSPKIEILTRIKGNPHGGFLLEVFRCSADWNNLQHQTQNHHGTAIGAPSFCSSSIRVSVCAISGSLTPRMLNTLTLGAQILRQNIRLFFGARSQHIM